MIIPVRCMSCGRPVGHLWEEYKKRLDNGEDAGKILDSLGLDKYCCRATFLGHADMLSKITRFKKA